MKKWILGFMLLLLPVLFVQLAVAQKKTPHKDYADMKIADCGSCHKGEGVAPNHDTDWVRGHRLLANAGQNNCVDCHDQSFCLDCHSGGGIDTKLSSKNYRADYTPKSHRSDFLEIHPLKALDNPQTCTRCHDQKYCTQCHSKFRGNSLQFQSHRRQFRDAGPANPFHVAFDPTSCSGCHPNSSAVPTGVWKSDHAREARRNLQACQSCHSDGDVCLKCHSARGGSAAGRLRVSPHPRNWNAVKNNYRDKSNRRTCLRCHDSVDPLIR